MPSKVTIDQATCTSCQLCADLLPGVFHMNAQGLAEVHDSEGAAVEMIQKVMGACPKACILWVDS